jgi:hypothetical protein
MRILAVAVMLGPPPARIVRLYYRADVLDLAREPCLVEPWRFLRARCGLMWASKNCDSEDVAAATPAYRYIMTAVAARRRSISSSSSSSSEQRIVPRWEKQQQKHADGRRTSLTSATLIRASSGATSMATRTWGITSQG